MIDQPLVEVKCIKETARVSILHLAFSWCQRQLLALVKLPFTSGQSLIGKTYSNLSNTIDTLHDTAWYYCPHTANDNSIMKTVSKRHDYGLMTEVWSLQPNNMDSF